MKKLNFKNPYLLATILGSLGGLAFAPVFFTILLIPAFSGLLYLLDNCTSKKQAFLVGWFFGLGMFVISLYWISIALLVDPSQFLWLMPFAVLGIPSAVAVYIGIVCLITYKLPFTGWRKVVAFSIIWLSFEFLRNYLFTGFPWNLAGYTLSFSDSMMQLASIFGIYGLSLIAVLMGSIFYLALFRKTFANIIAILLVSVTALGVYSYGYTRLKNAKDEVLDINLRIVQGNISQHQKWHPDLLVDNFFKHIELSKKPSAEKIDYIIWPESAVPYAINAKAKFLTVLANIKPTIFTGAIRDEKSNGNFQAWNSLFAIKSGKVIAYYDKIHLVPFGEYIPFRKLLSFHKLTNGSVDFSVGKKIDNMKVENLPPFMPLICYEVIFPKNNINPDTRPLWLLNATNDGWYGNSSGPYQHFHMARTRAIEQGVPLIRAANTGISAIVDSYGRAQASLALGTDGVIDGKLPASIPQTPYSKYGDILLLLVVYVLGMVTLTGLREEEK